MNCETACTHTHTILQHSIHISICPTPNLSPSKVRCWMPTAPHKTQWKPLLPYCPTAFPLHTLPLVSKGIAVWICLSLYVICMSELHVLLLVNWKESKLDLNHLFSCPKTTLRSLWNCKLFGLVINVLVSSANNIGIALGSMTFGKSLMYTRNNNGPKIEPCGTPYFILVHFETVLELRYKLMIWTLWHVFWR